MVGHQLNRLRLPFLLLMGGILLVWAFPYLVSAYHLEIGGRLVDSSESLAQDPSSAVEHLHKAIRWDTNNAQAYRLLGEVYRAQGNWPAAVEALARHTALRPNNPVGHFELAEIYEEAEAEMTMLRFANLGASLPQADVDAPDAPLDTPYSRPDVPSWHSYVAQTMFSLPPTFAERSALFMHPPSRVTYTLPLPPQPALLRFGMGMDPQTHDWPGDGVTFEVSVNGDRIFLEHVDKTMARQGWHERTVDLAPWVGQEVALTLAATPGPLGDTTGDWAGWGEPQVVKAGFSALETLQPTARMVTEWRRGAMTAQACFEAGEIERRNGQREQAWLWYARAIRLDPEWEAPYQMLRGTPKGDEVAVTFLGAGGGEAMEKARLLRPSDLYANFHLWMNAQASDDADGSATYREALVNSSLKAFQPANERLLDYAAAVIPALLEKGIWEREKTLSVVSFLVLHAPASTGVELLLETLSQNHPTEPDWPFYLAELYRNRGDLAQAEAVYQQALALDPTHEQTYLKLGMLSELQIEESAKDPQLEKTAKWYQQHYALAPHDLLGFMRVAEACIALEESGLESESCRKAAEQSGAELGGGTARESGHSPAEMLWTRWLEQAAAVEPRYLVNQELPSGWTFLGYDTDEERLARGEPVDLLLYWTGPESEIAGTKEDGWHQAGERWVQVLTGIQNLVPNGDFELGMQEGSPAGFPDDIYDSDPNTRKTLSALRAGQYTTAALLDNTTVHNATSFASVYVPINPEKLYLQAGSMKSIGGSGYLGRRWSGDITEVPPYSYVVRGMRSDDWQRFAGLAQPLEGADRCQVWLLNWQAEGQAYFDNVFFVEVGLPGK